MIPSLSGAITPTSWRKPTFDVITAVDGSDGLEKLYTHSCDLVLTDINMGHMDGYEFIRRVRAEPQYEDLPIIIVSTESEQERQDEGIRSRSESLHRKPLDRQ